MIKDKKLKCPIPNTHNRLNHAFSLFQNILEDYQNPLRFTSVLNSLIQNLRNITWILQKELAHTEGFKEWYPKKQNEMEEDDILKWLVKIRNYVVKEGDLKKKSIAKICLKNHYNHDLFKIELDPTLSTKDIAKDFCKKAPLKIQRSLLEQTIIEIERIWIIDEYPKTEIIDILIYCLGAITDLVYKCHEELLDINPLLCEQNLYVDPLEDFMITLHNKIKKGRITRINYKTGEIYGEIASVINHLDNQSLIIVKERYGDDKSISSLMDISDKNMPFNNIQYHLKMAKKIFNTDGFLYPIAFLYFANRPPTIISLCLHDNVNKYLVFEKLAETVEETGCEALIVVTEVFSGNLPKESEEYIPAYIQKKKEFISLVAATPDKKMEYQIEIVRDKDGKTILKNEEEVEVVNYSLDRIYKNWEINKIIKNKK